jgi:glutamate---cysteine ligase / carboxylate-amine ligase
MRRSADPARGARFRRSLPAWARWNADVPPWTLGLEEEIVLLHGATGAAANRIDDLLAAVGGELAGHVSAETHACVAELKNDPMARVGEATGQQGALRRALSRLLDERLGMRAAVAGTHPLLVDADVALTRSGRYEEIGATMRAVAAREPTMALHVHVAVPDGDAAARASDGLRHDMPLLLALSANSPFWRGADSGFASMRTPILSMFPRMGLPPALGSYRGWVEGIDTLIGGGAISDPSFVWWDVRIRPRLGTVEVRVMDAQTRIADSAALAALVQCLALRHAEGQDRPVAARAEVMAENRFLAARDGMRAELITPQAPWRRPVRDLLAEQLERCAPTAAALGCVLELESAAALAADPGDDRQRRLAAYDGLEALPGHLAAQFAPVPGGAQHAPDRPCAGRS